jgi:hypothetical protein
MLYLQSGKFQATVGQARSAWFLKEAVDRDSVALGIGNWQPVVSQSIIFKNLPSSIELC